MFRLKYKYQEEAGAEDGLAGGEAQTKPEENQPSVEELMAQVKQFQDENATMRTHMDELLGEKKAEQQRRKQEEEARKQAELEAQRKAGDLEAFEKTLTEQFGGKEAKLNSEIERLNNMILGGRKNEIIADMASSFVSPEVAKLMLGNLITTEHGENDTISTSFKGLDGQLVTTDPKAFKEYLMNNELFAPYLKGVDSSGGLSSAAKPAASGGQAPVTDKQKRIDAINKRFNS